MNFLVLLLSISGALATPVSLDKRQSFGGGSTENDFLRGGCKDVIMIFARGTTEPGNIVCLCCKWLKKSLILGQGNLVGPGLTDRLDRKYRNNFAMQGLDYPARLLDNLLPAGTTQQAINDMAKLFTDAATKCPNAKIVGGGYRYSLKCRVRQSSKIFD